MVFRALAVAFGVAGLMASAALAQSTLPLRPAADDAASTGDDWQTVTAVNTLPVAEAVARRKRTSAADAYAPVGIGSGSLRLYPTLTVGGIATSNLGRKASHREAGAGLALKPALRIESDWVRHSYTSDTRGDFAFYAANSDLDSRDFSTAHDLRLDVRRGTTLDVAARYALSQSGLEDSNVPETAVGYQTEHTFATSAAISHDFGPVQGRLKTGATWRRFGDVKLSGGGSQDNGDRDYVEPSLTLRASYSDPPVFKPFAEVGYAPRYHRQKEDRNGLRRDSKGYTAALGVAIDEGPIWTGEAALTYLHRDYADPALDSNGAFGINGNLTWSPAELTRIVASAETSIGESTSATSSGSRDWSLNIEASQALRDNVDLSAAAGIEFSKSDGGTDVTYDAGLALSWKMNPALAWTAAYDVVWLKAADGSRDYTEHRVTAGVTLSR